MKNKKKIKRKKLVSADWQKKQSLAFQRADNAIQSINSCPAYKR